MTKIQQGLLAVALLITIVGVAGLIYGRTSGSDRTAAAAAARAGMADVGGMGSGGSGSGGTKSGGSESGSGSFDSGSAGRVPGSSFLGSNDRPNDTAREPGLQKFNTRPADGSAASQTPDAAGTEGPDDAPPDSVSDWVTAASPWAITIGMAFIGGFALGFAARSFIRTAAVVAAVAVVAFLALSYFNILDIDFSRAQEAYRGNAEWLSTQGTKVLALVQSHLPSTVVGVIGLGMGLMRKG